MIWPPRESVSPHQMSLNKKTSSYENKFLWKNLQKHSLLHVFLRPLLKKVGSMTSIVVDMGVSKNRGGPPKSSILIGSSLIFTIHFGGKISLFLVQHPYDLSPSIPSNMQGPQTGQERLSKESDKLSSPPVEVATAICFLVLAQAQKITPPKTNGRTPKIGGLGRCFSFSFWGYFQVPAVCFQGCKEGS